MHQRETTKRLTQDVSVADPAECTTANSGPGEPEAGASQGKML
jgi:hypothetical protein